MPIEFQCPSCRAMLRTPDETAGQNARCGACGAVCPVPSVLVAEAVPGPSPWGDNQPPAELHNPYQSPTQYGGYQPPMMGAPRSDGRALAALILGLCGLFAWCCPLVGLAVGITGVVLGLAARDSADHGKAMAGVILCAICILLSVGNAVAGVIMHFNGMNNNNLFR